jgi:hypothetical protein
MHVTSDDMDNATPPSVRAGGPGDQSLNHGFPSGCVRSSATVPGCIASTGTVRWEAEDFGKSVIVWTPSSKTRPAWTMPHPSMSMASHRIPSTSDRRNPHSVSRHPAAHSS